MEEADATIGAYQIRGRLGSGGMGEVFLAYDERLRRHVAIKRIRGDMEMTPARRRRLRREARAAAGLSHPAIVQIHDILEDEGGDSIVMEYVRGRTLRQVLDEEGVEMARAVDLARQVAEGLAAAHDRGVIHRDLKAENVMVMPDGRARILDFGLAKPSPMNESGATLTREGAVLGTLRTMAPEQALGGEVSAETDLFSLGGLLFEMLAGRPPIASRSVTEIYHQLLNVKAPAVQSVRPDVPERLSALVGALLEKQPERRPQSAREVARQLAEAMDEPGLSKLGPASRTATPATSPPAASDASTLIPESDLEPPGGEPLGGEPAGGEPPASSTWAPGARRVRALWALGVLLALAAATAAVLSLRRAPPLRVLVTYPQVINATGSDREDLRAFAVQEAALEALRSLRGLEPVAQAAADRELVKPSAAARAAAADEVIAATLDFRDPGVIWVSLRRVDGRDDRVVWNARPFETPDRSELSSQLADAVAGRVRQAYPRHRPLPGYPAFEVRDEDYAVFLEFEKRVLAGGLLDAAELDQLAALTETSPRFLSAYIFAADTARTRGELERARDLLDRAGELAPDDPRPLYISTLVEIDAVDFDRAEARLAELERLVPGSLRVLRARARLLEKRGDLRPAADTWRRLVAARPSWQHLFYLSRVTQRLGEIDESRTHIRRALEISPRNPVVLARWAHLEMVSGDLEKAEELYRSLLEIRPSYHDYTNLGNVLSLRHRYAAAAESFRRALELAPESVMARLNLADAEAAAGHEELARGLHRQLCDELRDRPEARGLDGKISLAHAQCLVRLGEATAAVDIVQRTLRHHPEDANYAFQAALVYTLAGELHSALANAQEAMSLGFQPRWFQLPAFDALRAEPRFALLTAAGGGEER